MEFRHIIQKDYLSIGGIYRLRGEVQDEFNVKRYSTGTKDDFILSRLRLEIDLKLIKKFRMQKS